VLCVCCILYDCKPNGGPKSKILPNYQNIWY